MRKIKREATPDSLKQNAQQWTASLLNEISTNGSYAKVKTGFKDKYKQPDGSEALKRMNDEKCSYCESFFSSTSYAHIEHLRPKADPRFHHLSFEWTNLLYSCQICNHSKRNQWDDQYPIIDPCVDEPEQFFIFDGATCEMLPVNQSKRAFTTIDHTKMNRPELIKARKRLKSELVTIIHALLSTDSPNDERIYKQLIEQKAAQEMEHSTFIKQIVSEYLSDFL